MKLSAVICTHNPRRDYLDATLASIRAQTGIPIGTKWELLIIDNASREPLAGTLDLSWHANARVINESRLGLTFARLRSFDEARGEILIYIDDDNILAETYFANVLHIFTTNPYFGAIGGKSLPVYETDPPSWFAETGITLACRDLGDLPLSANWPEPNGTTRIYPNCAPIGAGMAVRRSAYGAYVQGASQDTRRTALGRRGGDLASGEDNDMIMSILAQGWFVAYMPELSLQHLIPASRLTLDYLAGYARSSNRTWVQVLDVHGICPWPRIARWTVPLRNARAFLRTKPWQSPLARLHWQAAIGQYEGRAALHK
jgi:glycosyltransferase involved in cell wall biosynthesis